MKILCVSDTIMPAMESAANLRRRYHDVELLISCGDMPAAYLEFITSVLNIPLFYVRGNHDEAYSQSPPGGEDLHLRIKRYKGLTFTGIEGSMLYNNGEVQYTDWQVNAMALKMTGRLLPETLQRGYGVDVLVTHSPPKGIHDKPDLPHQGFTGLLRLMRWVRPRYLLHGHVHTYDRRETVRTMYHQTCVLNINPVTVLEVDPIP